MIGIEERKSKRGAFKLCIVFACNAIDIMLMAGTTSYVY